MDDKAYVRMARSGAIHTYMQHRRRQKRFRRIMTMTAFSTLIAATLYLIAIAPQP